MNKPRAWAVLAVACLICPAVAATGMRFELQAGPTSFGEFSVAGIRVVQGEALSEPTSIEIDGISHARSGNWGSLMLRCEDWPDARCGEGALSWKFDDDRPATFEFKRHEDQFTLAGPDGGRVQVGWLGDAPAEVLIENLPAGWIPSSMRVRAGLADLSGVVSGHFNLDEDQVRGQLEIDGLDFDTPDGLFAGAGLALDAALAWRPGDALVQLEASWRVGELLLGPAYLPSPEAPFDLNLVARNLGADGWQVERFSLSQTGSLAISASGRLVPGERLKIAALDLEVERADLARLWRQGLNSLAGARGWGQLEPDGNLSGSFGIENEAVVSAGFVLSGVNIDDRDQRLAITGLGARLGWARDTQALEIDAHWQDAALLGIPLGGSALAFSSDASGTLALVDPFHLPVLDGALVVERLAWRDWSRDERRLLLDARLEPIDLSALTQLLGWTEFGGRLSGNFPGIALSGSAIEVQGGLDIDLFGGRARVSRLSIERPFGSLPALAADIEFDALDLEQVTGAFEFGRMLGLMSGHVRDLRLLDWQPVRFDAWFETLEDSPKREISQKAVDSISSLSGGGSAAISGTLLRWFDDFPYRKAGLGCRLATNVCLMRGLGKGEQGGYVILEGRLLPRLDIIGYQQRVDWPRLMAQLAAATRSGD